MTTPGQPSLSLAPQAVPTVPAMLLRHREVIESAVRHVLDTTIPSFYPMLHYHLGWADVQGNAIAAVQGKGLRPALCLFAAEALGGDWEAALPAAVALELIHNFSLIHDDIQDGDRERHNRATVWAVWGKPKGVVAGNALRTLADQALLLMTHREASRAVTLQASCILDRRYHEMIQGQVLDLSFEQRLDVGSEEYLEMIAWKTGALLDGAMELGALAGCGDAPVSRRLGQCGRLLGLAFQLRDDLLGVWGDDQETGKAVGADIRRRKKAFPAVFALQQASGADGRALRELYGSNEEMSEAQLVTILSIMERVQVQAAAQRLAEEQCRQALALADEMALEPWARTELAELAHFLLHRTS